MEPPHNHGATVLEERLQEQMPDEQDFIIVADIFKLLNDPSRLKIFWLLCHIEECVINLSAILNMSSPAISHHLKLLRANGLITSRRDGKEVYYKAAETEQIPLLHKAIERIMEISCPEKSKKDCVSPMNNVKKSNESQQNIIRDVHEYLMENIEKRITIEELSRLFPINQTSLKNGFKEIYGSSVATHMKEHRLEKAAELLLQTEMSVSEIASAVGYASKSKFSAAFSEQYQSLPLKYRKKHQSEKDD